MRRQGREVKGEVLGLVVGEGNEVSSCVSRFLCCGIGRTCAELTETRDLEGAQSLRQEVREIEPRDCRERRATDQSRVSASAGERDYDGGSTTYSTRPNAEWKSSSGEEVVASEPDDEELASRPGSARKARQVPIRMKRSQRPPYRYHPGTGQQARTSPTPSPHTPIPLQSKRSRV